MTNLEIQLDEKSIGAFLRSKRHEFNMTQQEVASICGISVDTYKKWEQGARIPPIVDIVILARFYHVSIETVLQLGPPLREVQDELLTKSGIHDSTVPYSDPENYSSGIYNTGSASNKEIFEVKGSLPQSADAPQKSTSASISPSTGKKSFYLKLGFIVFVVALVIALTAWFINLWLMRKEYQDHYSGHIERSIDEITLPENYDTSLLQE